MDRFQEAKEDVDRQRALAKLLIDNIGKSTKALAALHDFMKRAPVPQNVAEFNRKLIRVSNTVSEACAMAAQFRQTAEGDNYKKTSTTTSGSQQQGGGNNKREREPDNTKEEKRKRRNTTSANVNAHSPLTKLPTTILASRARTVRREKLRYNASKTDSYFLRKVSQQKY